MDSSYNVINTVAGASDVTVSGGIVQITGAPQFKYSTLKSWSVLPYMKAKAQSYRVAVSASNNTAYAFSIAQYIDGNLKTKTIRYTSDASATTTEICNALDSALNAAGFEVTTVNSAPNVDITAASGYELFSVTNISNCTVTNTIGTIAPNGTAATAITNSIAPDGTAATAIAGTTTVTVTTLADHGLEIGDVVKITGVATMVLSGGLGSDNYVVATTPTATTFTLANATATGTNSGTITIRWQNGVIVNSNAAHSLSVGNSITVASIATMTVNGTSSFTGRVRNVPSTTQVYVAGVTPNNSNNSGTITITNVAQYGRNTAALLDAAGVDGTTAGYTYTAYEFEFTQDGSPSLGVLNMPLNQKHTIYAYESDSDFTALKARLADMANGYKTLTQTADPELFSIA